MGKTAFKASCRTEPNHSKTNTKPKKKEDVEEPFSKQKREDHLNISITSTANFQQFIFICNKRNFHYFFHRSINQSINQSTK